LRITTQDKPGVLSQVTGILGRNNVSIASVHQDTFEEDSNKSVPIILITHMCTEADVQKSVDTINQLPQARAKTVVLRLE
jgi:homoserine dehydrogenase